jgi:hypothetical protein
MFSYVGSISHVLNSGMQQSLTRLSDSISTSALTSTSRIGSFHHNSGETNRYTKHHIQRVITKEPVIPKPPKFANLCCKPHKHAELASDKHIRLLRLMPASEPDDLIRCKVEENRLAEDLRYDALSYTWGNLPRDFPILIIQDPQSSEDHALFASPSLYAALKHLRRPEEARLLWIDQLYINQDDLEEKSTQVKLMADIYAMAQSTVIWLGEMGEADEDRAVLSEMIDLFKDHYPGAQVDDIQLLRPKLDLSDHNEVPLGLWSRQPLTRLLNRSWFSRAWVFQEAVKSAYVTVLCGSLELSLDLLLRLTQATFAIEVEDKGYAYSLTKSTTGFDMLYLVEHSRPGGCGHQDCERKQVKPGFLGLLMQVLQQVEATDSHDLIYAFMAFKGKIKIDPIYTIPVTETWTEAAKSIIRTTGSLDIFAAVRGNNHTSRNLPSWVPDWSQCYPYARPVCAPDFKSAFRACDALFTSSNDAAERASEHIWEEADPINPEILIAKGKRIGIVSWLNLPNFEGVYYRKGLNHVFQFELHLKPLKRHLGTRRNEPGVITLLEKTDKELTEIHMRTLLADGAFGHTQPVPDSPRELIDICQREDDINKKVKAAGSGDLPTELQFDKAVLDRCRQWSLVAQMKKVFLCQQEGAAGGLDLGLAPQCVEVGDVVALLRGSKTPCLLRPLESGRWRIIGQCYLDGWMYGVLPAGRNLSTDEDEKFVLV